MLYFLLLLIPLSLYSINDPITAQADSVLFAAAFSGNIEAARAALKAGANVNKIDSTTKRTPLGRAIDAGNKKMVVFLLANNANVNGESNYLSSPLHRSASLGNIEIVRTLLEHNADITKKDSSGNTALYYAALHGHAQVISLLLEYDAEIDALNLGETALHAATRMQRVSCVKLLLEEGASVKTIDANDSPLMIAAKENNLPIAQLLLEYGADPNTQNFNLETPLHFAAMQKNKAMIELLIFHRRFFITQSNNNRNYEWSQGNKIKNGDGLTPYDIAQSPIKELLRNPDELFNTLQEEHLNKKLPLTVWQGLNNTYQQFSAIGESPEPEIEKGDS